MEGPFCALAIDEQRSLETLADTITKAVRQAQGHWIQTSSEPLRIDAACVGMSGLLAMQAEDRVRSGVHACLKSIGHPLPASKLSVRSDIEIAHEGALEGAAGVVLIVGTGAVAYARNERGQSARSDGLGTLLGDAGSGYAIGRRALRAVCADLDGRGHATRLTELVLAHFGVTGLDGLVRKIYGPTVAPADIADVARLVVALTREEDPAASHILELAGDELATTVLSVLEKVSFEQKDIHISWQGGLARGAPELIQHVTERVRARKPDVVFVPPRGEPVHGALIVARRLV